MAFTPRNVVHDVTVPAPDFGLMAKSAQAIQTRYLDGFNKAKSYYNSLLNADITSKDNDKYRAEYFKKVNQYLTNLSGVDFSNPANVKAATDLFQPLVKDKDFVTDLTWTSMQNAERSKMEDVRTNKNEKIRSQYDPMMQKAMDYSYQDMQNAKRGDGSIGKVGVQKFVPFQNIQNALNKAAKDLKLNVSIDRLSGMYIITDKNGENAYPAFLQWARQQMGTSFDEQLLVTGKVKTREQVDALMQGDPNLSKEDAYQQVAKNNSLGIYKNFTEYKDSLNQGIQTISKRIDEISSKHNGKIAKNDPDFQRIAQLKTLKSQYEKEISGLDQSKDQDIQTAFDQYMANPEYAIMPGLKDNIAKQWAEGYVNTHGERKIKENRVAMQERKMKFDSMMEDKKHRYREDEIRLRERLKFERKQAEKIQESSVYAGTDEESGEQDVQKIAEETMYDLMTNTQKGYFAQDVLEVAAASTDLSKTLGVSYVDLAASLKNVTENWSKYGSSPEKNAQYFRDFNNVKKLLQRINPGIKDIKSVGDIMEAIETGVKYYKGGNPTKAKSARQTLSSAQESFDEYVRLSNEEAQKIEQLKKGDGSYYSFDYFDKDYYNKTGKLKLRTDLSADEKATLYPLVIPDYDKFSSYEKSKTTGINVQSNPKKFNYGAVDEVIQNAKYASDFTNDKNINTKDAESLMEDIRNTLQGSGGEYSDVFDISIIKNHKYNIHGEPFLKVDLSLKTDKKGDKKIKGIKGGSVSFFIPESKARTLWQATKVAVVGGKAYNVPVYPGLNQVSQSIFQKTPIVTWIDKGLNETVGGDGIADIPETILTKYGISDGNFKFSPIDDALYIQVTVDPGETPQSKLIKIGEEPLTKSMYLSDPSRFSNFLNSTLNKVLQNFSDKKETSLNQQRESQEIAMRHNPENYVSPDDIPELDNNMA